MPQAVDYSFSRPAPADLAAAGYTGALRYLCTLPNAKAITGDEIASLHANGLAVGLVWEDGAANALAGSVQGMLDGKKARRQADDLGLPTDRPIYAAVDVDAQTFQFDTVDAYLRAFSNEIGRPVGVYGSWLVVEAMLDRGAATFAWQTAAWSHGKRSARAHLYQLIGGAPPGCDVNDILADDWGQWPAPSQHPPAPPEDDDMYAQLVKKTGDPAVYVAGVGIVPRHVVSFADADLCTVATGVHLQPPPAAAKIVKITDAQGSTRDVWEVDPSGAALFGLG